MSGQDKADLSSRLASSLDSFLSGRPGRVSVAVADHASGLTAIYQPDSAFETASIIKIDILAALLLNAQDTPRQLTKNEEDLATRMIENSDNGAAETLWQSIGGAQSINTANQRFGLSETKPNAKGWGLTTTTAADQLRLLTVLLEGGGVLGGPAVMRARDLMGAVIDSQRWGISAAANSDETIELKNGWDTRDNDQDRWIVNSVGTIRTASRSITLVVLSDGHATMQTGIDIVEQVAKLTREQLG